MTNLALALRALWFKVLVDAIVSGSVTRVTVLAIALAVSDASRSVALVYSQMARQDIEDKALQYFQEQSMFLAGAAPGIAHYEDQEHLDKIEEYKGSFPILASALTSVTDGVALAARGAFTLALLASVHPLLLALPLFALPALAAGRRSQTILQQADAEVAPSTRALEHGYALLTQPLSAKEVRLFGIGSELRARDRVLWRKVTATLAVA